MKQIYIIQTGKGIPIFQYSYIQDKDTVDSGLFGAGVAGIVHIMQEMTQSRKQPKVFDQGDIKVLLENGKYTTAILVSSHDLKILHEKLRELISEVEEIYEDLFLDWSGDLDVFSPIKKIVEKVFPPFPVR